MTDMRIDSSYWDFWTSEKKVRILRSSTPASGKSMNAALMCAFTAMNGNNVLCLMKRRETLRDCVMNDTKWALDHLRPKSIHRVNLNRMEIELDTGYRILFRSWDDDDIDYITVPEGFIGMVWWEECQNIPLDDLMNHIKTAPSMRRAMHVCTGRLFRDHPSWLNTIESNDFTDVFDKSYKDNEYLAQSDVEFIEKHKEAFTMNMNDVYEFGKKVDISGSVTTTYETLDPHGFGWALRCLKDGLKVSRKGWNGKGMWLALQLPDENSKMNRPYIYMKAVNDELVPWVASQTDLLADDWMASE